MRKIMLATLLMYLAMDTMAQEADNKPVDNFLLDFSVPDMPAFKALGTDPSNILRPTDVQKFAVMFNAFRSEGETIIPRSFSLEVAPWKLTKGSWTIGEYRKSSFKRILYNSSF